MANLSGFINVDYFLGRIFHPPITLQNTPFVAATLETLGYFSMHDDSSFLALTKLAISSQLQAMNFDKARDIS